MNEIYHKYQKIHYQLFIICFLVSFLFSKTGLNDNYQGASGKNTTELISEISKVQIPFIGNEGQVDNRYRILY